MNSKKLISIFLCFCWITECSGQSKVVWGQEKKRVQDCQEKWIYKDLNAVENIKVLLFIKKSHFDVSSYPNFIIGITLANDTIAILDKEFTGVIKNGDKIRGIPYSWSSDDKDILKPLFVLYKKQALNNLYCSVKNVYYGKIDRNKQ